MTSLHYFDIPTLFWHSFLHQFDMPTLCWHSYITLTFLHYFDNPLLVWHSYIILTFFPQFLGRSRVINYATNIHKGTLGQVTLLANGLERQLAHHSRTNWTISCSSDWSDAWNTKPNWSYCHLYSSCNYDFCLINCLLFMYIVWKSPKLSHFKIFVLLKLTCFVTLNRFSKNSPTWPFWHFLVFLNETFSMIFKHRVHIV